MTYDIKIYSGFGKFRMEKETIRGLTLPQLVVIEAFLSRLGIEFKVIPIPEEENG